MKRQEQRVENTWRLEDLYENEVLFSQDAEKLDTWMEQFAELQGTLQGYRQCKVSEDERRDADHGGEDESGDVLAGAGDSDAG